MKADSAAALPEVDRKLVDGLLTRGPTQRRALAKTITLVESTRADHQLRAQNVLTELLPRTGRAIRVGISGVPGSGKSTFIEVLGNFLIDAGKRLAVLAVDPSSSISGGSILGDKTRMESLCQREEAFIRPSPTSGSLGGVADNTREAMLVCEAAGFDVIIVDVPDPQTAQLNRFYTVEFFRAARMHLKPGGLLALELRSSEETISPDLARASRKASPSNCTSSPKKSPIWRPNSRRPVRHASA